MLAVADDAFPLHAGFVAVYLLVLVGVGALKARGIRSQEEFSLAGRGLGTMVLVGTLLATWIGTGSIFGNAEKTYRIGVAVFLLPLSSAAGIAILWTLAPRLRRFGAFTIQDILERRFGPAARVLGTITLLLAYVIIVSYQYRAGAAVLERVVPGISPPLAVCAVAAFVILYTALAGMFSVAYTDVANGILMALGLALAIPILLDATGGLSGALESLTPEQRDPFHFGTVELVSIMLPALLLILGDANMVQRFFSAKDEASARRAAGWMLGGVLLLDWAIVTVAFLGIALVAQGQISAPENAGHVVVHLAFEALPPLLGALLVGTVVAVVVSTADSYLLAPATSLVRDVVQRFLVPDLSEAGAVRAGRIAVVLLGLVALGLAFTSDAFFDVAIFAYTIYGAGITPALLAAYFWRRATSAGAFASMLTGVVTALAWKALADPARAAGDGPLADLSRWVGEASAAGIGAVLPAVAVSLVVLVVVSLLTPPPSAEQASAL